MSEPIRVLIISPDGPAADKARRIGEKLLGKPGGTLLATPLSATGQHPATHWLCENRFPRDVFEKMMSYPRELGTRIIDAREEPTPAILRRLGLTLIAEATSLRADERG